MKLFVCLLFWRLTTTMHSKRRLCVDVEVENYRSDTFVLRTFVVGNKQKCFINCMRENTCKAYHFRYQDGLCDLLPKPDICQAQTTTNGTLYVELNTCGLFPPRKAFLPPVVNWKWVSDVTDLTGTVAKASSGTRYVSRVFERGVYLPGWWITDRFGFRTVSPFRKDRSCYKRPGELLIFPKGGYLWVSFQEGGPVPTNAVMGGYWMDLSPLYIVKITVGWFMCSGYYSVSVNQAFVDCNGVNNPISMEILCYD